MRAEVGLLLALFAAGCMPYTRAVDVREQRERFPFLREGETTREACVAAIGEPSARYEGGRVLAWRMSEKEGKLVVVPSSGEFNLMLAFDDGGVLTRFNLVEIR